MSGNDLLDRESEANTDKDFSDIIDNNWTKGEQGELKALADRHEAEAKAEEDPYSHLPPPPKNPYSHLPPPPDSAKKKEESEDKKSPFNFHQEGIGGGLDKAKSNAKNKLKDKMFGSTKNKVAAAGAGVGGGAFLLFGMIVLMMALSSMKIINFGEVMATASFMRFNGIMNERTTQDIFDAATVNGDGEITASRSLVDKILLRDARKQLSQLGTEDRLKFNTDAKGNLESVKIGDEVIGKDAISQKNWGKNYDQLSIREKLNVRGEFTKSVQTTVGEAFETEPRYVRGKLFDIIAEKEGFKFNRFRQAGREFFGKTPVEANTLSAVESAADVSGEANIKTNVGEIDTVTETLKDPEVLEQFLKDEGGEYSSNKFFEWLAKDADAPTTAIKNVEGAMSVKGIASDVSMAVLVLSLSCMANQTFKHAGDIQQENETSAIKLGLQLVSARDQNKAGALPAEAIGALSSKLDGGDQAPAYQAATNRPIDTVGVDDPRIRIDTTMADTVALLTSPSHFGAAGHIVDKFPGGKDALSALDDNFCDKLLSPGGIITVAALDLLVQAVVGTLTGGVEVAAEETVGQAVARTFVVQLAKATYHTIGAALSPKGALTLGAVGLYGVGLKLAASSLAGNTFSGAEVGPNYVQSAGVGLQTLQARQLRSQYARPITVADAKASDDHYTGLIKQEWNNKGVFARYFSPENPYSVTGAVAAATPSSFATTATSVSSAITQFGKVLQPLALFRLFGNMFTGGSAKALAASNYDVYNGLPQWGFSADELNKIRNVPSYTIVENEKIMTPDKVAALDSTLGPCFDPARSQIDADKAAADPNSPCSLQKLSSDEGFRYRLYKLDSLIADKSREDILATYNNDRKVQGATPTTPGVTGSTAAGEFVWPESEKSTMSQCYTWTGSSGHPGLDIFAGEGSPIFAVEAGIVTKAGEVSGYGPNFVAIKHANGLGTSYGHMNSKLVKEGDTVTKGQQIGTEGNLGDSRGSHLHFNMFPDQYSGRDGPNVNPLSKGMVIPAGVNNAIGCK